MVVSKFDVTVTYPRSTPWRGGGRAKKQKKENSQAERGKEGVKNRLKGRENVKL